MGNTGLMIGLIWFFMIAQVSCNFYGDRDMYENVDIRNQGAAEQSITTATDTEGTGVTWLDVGAGAWDFITKLFAFNYPCFQNTDGSDNEFIIIRYLLIAVGFVMWIDIAYTIRRIARGS